ncbi:MAG: hypothetical protein KAQ85_09055 [Thermodesulfovibrionia bacterium]|nr:hypothetical protein [Thermodesulfovibrionia bacterium]MCK5512594.1 hypothetical protein [Thermodesulfovibrionia bacterium]
MREELKRNTSHKARRYYGTGCLSIMISIVILVVCVYVGVRNLSHSIVQLMMPGEYEIEFFDSGTYTAFYEFISDKKESDFGTKLVDPPTYRDPKTGLLYQEGPTKNLKCRIQSLERNYRVPLSNDDFDSPDIPDETLYFLGKRAGYPIFQFTIDEPGKYTFSCHYPNNEIWYHEVISFGLDYQKQAFLYFLLPMAIAILGGSAGIILIIIGFLKRKDATA